MYTPLHFKQDDPAILLDFMRAYPFATLVTVDDQGVPTATHLPVVVAAQGEQITLHAHVARQNTQWQHFKNSAALLIFQEPHAYISPRWYEKENNVPTWNYVAVHAYGTAQIIENELTIFEDLERLIQQSEPAYMEQWQRLSPEYKSGMAKGIVAFRIAVDNLQGKEKLSQNKTAHEQQQIITGLENSVHSGDQQLANLMRVRDKKAQ